MSLSMGTVRIVWGEADPYFHPELGPRLSGAFPHATLTTVPAGRTFLPLDHPGEVADEIAAASQRSPGWGVRGGTRAGWVRSG